MKINNLEKKLENILLDRGFEVNVKFFMKNNKISFMNIRGSINLIKIWSDLNEDRFYLDQIKSANIFTLKRALPKIKIIYTSKNKDEKENFKRIEKRVQEIMDYEIDNFLDKI